MSLDGDVDGDEREQAESCGQEEGTEAAGVAVVGLGDHFLDDDVGEDAAGGGFAARAKNATPIRRPAACSLDSGSGWRNCHKMISPLATSTVESRPNPSSAAESAI